MSSATSRDHHLVGEGAAADPQRDYRADRVSEVYGEAALAHLAVPDVHLALPEVLFHHQVSLRQDNRIKHGRSCILEGDNIQHLAMYGR